MTEPGVKKDFWDRLQIVLSPVGGLLTAIAVASLGLFGSKTLERQQSSEAKLRLYSELMTRREESEATLRKEMFQSIIGSFFDASSADLDTRLLKMELLAQNFHEALNLVPLFEHMQREIDVSKVSREEKRFYASRQSAVRAYFCGAEHRTWTTAQPVGASSGNHGTWRRREVDLSCAVVFRSATSTDLCAIREIWVV